MTELARELFRACDVFSFVHVSASAQSVACRRRCHRRGAASRRKAGFGQDAGTRHGLPPRHLETVLHSLVRDGILKGIRGPRGGYELARDRARVTANDILRAAGTVDGLAEGSGSELMDKLVVPALSVAEAEFGSALDRINLDDMARRAESLNGGDPDKQS
jgi:Rrf2 family protein